MKSLALERYLSLPINYSETLLVWFNTYTKGHLSYKCVKTKRVASFSLKVK